jgi:predicted kinase
LFPAIQELIGRLLSRNVSVLVDATNLKESNRKPYYQLAGKFGARLILVRTWATATTIRDRLRRREAGADRDDRSTATLAVFAEMRQDFEQIRRRHVSVNTSLPLAAALDKIVDLLEAD